MERKVFYTLHGTQGGFKIMKHDGFEFVINDKKFNAYKDKDGDAYIIDPEIGLSVFKCYVEDLYVEMDAVSYARDQFVMRCFVQEAVSEKMKSPAYQMMVEMFNAFKHGAELGEKLSSGTLSKTQGS